MMLVHPDPCSCFCCVYEVEALMRIEAGLLDRMDLIMGLMQILARTINSHPSPEAADEAETSPPRPN